MAGRMPWLWLALGLQEAAMAVTSVTAGDVAAAVGGQRSTCQSGQLPARDVFLCQRSCAVPAHAGHARDARDVLCGCDGPGDDAAHSVGFLSPLGRTLERFFRSYLKSERKNSLNRTHALPTI